MRYIPVVPEAEIGLESPCVGDAKRFCPLFREVWQGIPDEDRNTLIDDWRSRPVTTRPCLVGLETGLRLVLQRDEPGGRRGAAALALSDGHTILFLGPYIDSVPPWVVKAVIAHELAHLYLRIDNPDHTCQSPEHESKAECDAARLGDEWGFQCTRALGWHHKHEELYDRCLGA